MATFVGTTKPEARPGFLLLVIHDFVARSADELSLAKGDRIELIERDDDFGDGWFLGRHMANGNTGLFPEVYTTPAPKGTFANPPHSRRTSDGQSKPGSNAQTVTTPVSPTTQQRHLSDSVVPQRPASGGAQTNDASPLVQTSLRTSLPLSAPSTKGAAFNADSPVMNETLSVIDEHITDMNTPRSSYANGNKRDTLGSVYSTQPLHRFSYIPGHETDEDEQHSHTEGEVMAWSPERVAEYLEDQGVEKSHCNVFKEQEISGEVLLAMDQGSLFIKEFDLGSVGRRLKTWHKVKALQEEVKRSVSPEATRATSQYSEQSGDAEEIVARNRSSTIGTLMPPRALETASSRQNVDAATGAGKSNTLQPQFSQASHSAGGNLTRGSSIVSPLQSMTSVSNKAENTYRPSAQTIRTMNQSRRHSSIDSSASADTSSRQGHRKVPSIDKTWQAGQPAQANGRPVGLLVGVSAESPSATMSREPSAITPSSPGDLDRGYFSSNELENRTRASRIKILQKKDQAAISPVQSRNNSFMHHERHTSAGALSSSRTVSIGSPREPVSPLVSSGTSQEPSRSVNPVTSKAGGLRSSTSPQLASKPMVTAQDTASPMVTKLDYSNTSSLNAVASSPAMQQQAGSETSSVNAGSSPPSGAFAVFGNVRNKVAGFRTTSDAVTKHEKTSVPPADRGPITKQDVSSPTRTGSTTPSTETKSFDLPKSDVQSRASTGSGTKLMPPPTSTRRALARSRTKKTTSAYTRGLERKTPAEGMATCDYSGWMKKKSGSLITTWKPRLFVLKGRRLSYYYSDDDTEEKGLIDISFHRVLAAHHETLTGLHAAMTGAAGSPTSPKDSLATTTAQQDLEQHPPPVNEEKELFIFKLVPPKAGLSKAVNFTKPTVHYFAVNSRQEGRLWMAALMKATIDRDEDGVVTTTYNQKTISLAKARARRERPPALREEHAELEAGDNGGAINSQGLGIGGLNEKGDESPSNAGPVAAGASTEQLDEKAALKIDGESSTGLDTLVEGEVVGAREREPAAANV